MNAGYFRQRARENLRGKWAVSIAVAALCWLLGGLITGSTFIPHFDTNSHLPFFQKWQQLVEQGFRIGNTTFRLRNGILGLVGFILGGTMELGHARFLLKQHDGEDPDWRELFSQFDRFGQGFTQAFLRNLYAALWTLLFIIPGIVKGLSYAMTPFIMIEEPNLSASEAIEKSTILMDGHKGELFVLHLSFLGWSLLAAISLNLGNLLLNPYKSAAEAAFYRKLKSQHPYL